MTDRQLRIDIDVVTRKAQQALKDSEADAKKLGKSLDDTRTHADRVADAIEAMAAASQAEMKQAEAAASALGTALGPEMVTRLQQSGESTDQWAMKLNALGLSFKEIEADADRLAASIRKVDDARPAVDNLEASTQRAATSVRRVGTEADQSRSVLANMVGNSVQDMGQLAGVAGSAGVMIGQIGEYAADGNINLKSLTALAAPMLFLAGATALVSDHFSDIAATKAFHKEQVEGYTKALKGATSELAAIQSRLENAGKIEFRIWDDTVDVTAGLAEAGVTVAQFSQLVAGGKPKIDEWAAAMRAAGVDTDNVNGVVLVAEQQAKDFATAQEAAAASATFFGNANQFAGMTAQEIADRLKDQADRAEYVRSRLDAATAATDDSEESSSNYADALARVRQELVDARDALKDWYDQQLGAIDSNHSYLTAVAQAQKAVSQFNADLKDGKLKGDDLTLAVESTTQSMVSAAAAYATVSGEVEGTQGYIDAMNESLYNQASTLDPSSPVFRAVTGYIAELGKIPRNVTTRFEVDDRRIGAHASGGTDSQPFVAGENGPELVDPQGRSARVFMAGETSSIFRNVGRVQNVSHTSVSNAAPATPIAAAARVEQDAAVDLAKVEADAAAEQRRVWGLQYEFGEISREQYRTLLKGQVDDTRKYDTEQVSIRRELRALDREDEQQRRDEAKKAADEAADRQKAENERLRSALEERERIIEEYRARREALDAADAATAAVGEMIAANADLTATNKDRKATAEDKADARTKLDQAIERAAEALYRRADARANAAGFEDDSVEWSRMVRAALLTDVGNAPMLRDAVERILVGIPDMADGGVVRARPGGRIVRVAEAGRDEAIVPLDRAGVGGASTVNVTMYTSADPNASVAALQRFVRYNGPRALARMSRVS